MMLLKERALYAGKLSDIWALGENLDWEERSGLIERIRPMILAAKERLKSDGKNQAPKQ